MSDNKTGGADLMVALRPYQLDAIERSRARLRTSKRVLLVAPTGAGKTVVAAEIIRRAHAKGRRVIFFAHRRELIHQTRRKLIAAGIPPEEIGIMMGHDPLSNPGAPIQIASIDTFRNRQPPPADLAIVDEAHRSLSKSYRDAIAHYSEAGAAVLGLTATPYRADGGGLGDVYEALEVVTSPAQLIAERFLVAPRVFSAPMGQRPDLTGVRSARGDYVEADLADAVNTGKLVGGIVEHWQKHAEGRRTVAFSVNVAHSEAITAAFTEEGIPAEHLDGTTPTAERDAILARLSRGETLIVSNCGVLCEGWDQPSVKCAILARPTKSTGLYLQQAGRILRPWEGVGAVILDHAGNALEHGLPQDDREFTLDRSLEQEGRARRPRECPECNAVVSFAAEKCPECGYVFPAGETEEFDIEGPGELVEVEALPTDQLKAAWDDLLVQWESINQRRSERGDQPMKPGWMWHKFIERYNRKPPKGCSLPVEPASEDEKAAVLLELREKCATNGYKPGWVRHRFAARFGHAPGATP